MDWPWDGWSTGQRKTLKSSVCGSGSGSGPAFQVPTVLSVSSLNFQDSGFGGVKGKGPLSTVGRSGYHVKPAQWLEMASNGLMDGPNNEKAQNRGKERKSDFAAFGGLRPARPRAANQRTRQAVGDGRHKIPRY